MTIWKRLEVRFTVRFIGLSQSGGLQSVGGVGGRGIPPFTLTLRQAQGERNKCGFAAIVCWLLCMKETNSLLSFTAGFV